MCPLGGTNFPTSMLVRHDHRESVVCGLIDNKFPPALVFTLENKRTRYLLFVFRVHNTQPRPPPPAPLYVNMTTTAHPPHPEEKEEPTTTTPARRRIDLVPWDYDAPAHVARMYAQRVACGWRSGEVRPGWVELSRAGRKMLYWVVRSLRRVWCFLFLWRGRGGCVPFLRPNNNNMMALTRERERIT